mgnify:CR=1 FL=1
MKNCKPSGESGCAFAEMCYGKEGGARGALEREQVACDVAERVFPGELHPRAERRADLFGPFLVVVEPL